MALTATPAAAETTGPAVVHTPVLTAPYGQPIPISLTANCATGAACAARLFYRTTVPAAIAAIPGMVNEAGFTVAGLTPAAPTATANGVDVVPWSGQIPGGTATTTGVDYYLEVEQNGAITKFPGSTYANGTQPTGTYVHVAVLSPPLLNHVPIPFATASQPIPVDAQVSCSSGTCSATLHYRKTPSATWDTTAGWHAVAMQVQGAGTPLGGTAVLLTFRADVPAASVDTMGVDYYIQATDGHTQVFSPGTTYEGWYAPRDGYHDNGASYHVHVLEPPRLAHVPVATAPYRQPIPVSAKTNCPSARTCAATLYYRTTPPGTAVATGFASTAMSVARIAGVGGLDGISVDGVIPASVADTRGVDYYFSVTDGTTTSWWPGTSAADSPGTWVDGKRVAYQHTHVQEPPHLLHIPPTIAPALQDFVVQAELTCATESCTATLLYNGSATDLGSAYQSTSMQRVAVRATTPATRTELWEGRIPAAAVTTRGLGYYITASDGYTSTAAPGTSYWGAYATVDGSNPAPAEARFVLRVVDPPHPVHVPVGAAFTGEPIPIEAKTNCATHNCTTTLYYRITGGTWQSTSMAGSAPTATVYGNDIRSWTAAVPGTVVTTTGVEYRVETSDGYATESTQTYPVAVTDRPAPTPTTTSTTLPPVTTTSSTLPSVTTTSTSLPPVTTTSLPPVTTTIPPVTTTSTSLPPVTTTSTTLPPVTTTLPPVTTTRAGSARR